MAVTDTAVRGPEIELWLGTEQGADPAVENDWSLLPFMALSDGAHASTEDYSYFTLRRAQTPTQPATSLFGISCTRQLDATKLIDRPPEVTRSTVQKAVVVISDSPQHFGAIKAQLGVVTQLWFAQRYKCHQGEEEVIMRLTGGIGTLRTLRFWSGLRKAYPSCLRTRRASRTTILEFLYASSSTSSNGRRWFSSSARCCSPRYAMLQHPAETAHGANLPPNRSFSSAPIANGCA